MLILATGNSVCQFSQSGVDMTKDHVPAELNWGFSDPLVYRFRGWLMLLTGSIFLFLTAVKPHVETFFGDHSWLPFIGIFLMIIGSLRFLDGILASRSPRFHLNLQGGVFDFVVGFIVLMHVGEEAVLLYLLIACYLVTQGLVRLIASFYLTLQNPLSSRIAGSLSLITGSMVWVQWPSSGAWFLSVALSIEVASRGGALLQLARALDNRSLRVDHADNG